MSIITSLSVLRRAGVVRPMSPAKLRLIVRTIKAWGTGPAGGFTQLALTRPDQVGIIDELGELTFRQIHERSNALAHGLKAQGVKEGDQVAVMCRNHRGFVEASIAVAKLGADLLYLNTAFAGPQLRAVLDREAPVMVIHDEEFTGLLEGASVNRRVVGWVDGNPGGDSLESLIGAHPATDLQPPSRHARIIILTSGTTGTPKGAPRKEAGISNGVSLMSRLPLESGWRTHIAAPLFHTWGLAHMFMAMLLGSTMVLRRGFDPEEALRSLQDDRCDSFVVIPVMLQRILNLPEDVRAKYDLSHLKVTAASGSALPGDLALEWMNAFGDNLYNIYGSTEVAYASIAMPDDLRASPESAGKPPYATTVKILDAAGKEVPQGESGRIFVANKMLFDGYTGGGNKEIIDGLMSTGDLGRFDADGRLHVEGRDDEMIVSGGENVFPREVEDCLVRHDAVLEAAAVGVEDPEFGKRLRAFVVVSDPAAADEKVLKDWVRANLARYKVPREIVFLEELPRNATGKILKRTLAEQP
ncbi:AMP-binding protein [Nocardioides sp. Y6]|uniref:AMP-binding protein n=1 Tax=Nocardioides malaquae TaxID=2773426 RepID=A0ABR9RUP4_9ACTN|nr:AMP-binding protein [Nocardioides malaquae]MBE7325272.1 AMP-binding protein [Nocardioides malaquae]